MPSAQTIRCITKDEGYSPYETITFVGGIDLNGAPWRITQGQAIDGIESGRWIYFVDVPARGDRVKVIVAVNHHGEKYLKTEADQDIPTDLLNLPRCP